MKDYTREYSNLVLCLKLGIRGSMKSCKLCRSNNNRSSSRIVPCLSFRGFCICQTIFHFTPGETILFSDGKLSTAGIELTLVPWFHALLDYILKRGTYGLLQAFPIFDVPTTCVTFTLFYDISFEFRYNLPCTLLNSCDSRSGGL